MNQPRIYIVDFLKSEFDPQTEASAKYESLSQAIKLAIEREELAPGSSLPAERKLAEILNISRISVRNAVDALVSEGQLVRRHGARTSVSDKVRKQISNLAGFSEDIRSRGMVPGMQLLSAEAAVPTEIERTKLKLEVGAKVV